MSGIDLITRVNSIIQSTKTGSRLIREIPNFIDIRIDVKNKMGIIGTKDLDLMTVFPFPYYDIVVWVVDQSTILGDIKYIEDDLIDEYLILDDSKWALDIIDDKNIDDNKIIHYHSGVINGQKTLSVCFGERNSDKEFIVLAPYGQGRTNGLMWLWTVAPRYKKLFENKFEMFIDLQNYSNTTNSLEEIGLYNAWDLFFKQFTNYSMGEIYNSKTVHFIRFDTLDIDDRSVVVEISDRLITKVASLSSELFGSTKCNEILGMYCRGTDYYLARYHEEPFDPHECAEVMKNYMSRYNFKKAFICTEDIDILDAIIDKDKSKVIYLPRKRFSVKSLANDDRINLSSIKVGSFASIIASEDYIVECLLLSHCGGIVSSKGTAINFIKSIADDCLFFDVILYKWENKLYGLNPIHVYNHNRNLFLIGVNEENNNDSIIRLNFAAMPGSHIIARESIRLYSEMDYYISIQKSIDDYNVVLSFFLKKQFIKSVKIPDKVRLTQNCDEIAIIIETNKQMDIVDELKIQIEIGSAQTTYVTPRMSETIVPLIDESGLLLDSSAVSAIDIDEGTILVSNNKRKISNKVRQLINRIVRFEGGFTEYRIGDNYYCDELININDESKIEESADIESLIPLIKENNNKSAYYVVGCICGLINSGNQLLSFIGQSLFDYESSVNHRTSLLYVYQSRCFRDGRGVPKDLNKAAEYMRQAVDANYHGWKNELFDVLWKIGTPESYEEMIKVAEESASTGDKSAAGRLGRAYRDGKGVPKDLDKAAEYMRLAADSNPRVWKNELFDVLWKIGTPESYSEMVKVAEESASTGDKGAAGRLGRAYRDGKGVPKDLDKAAEYMRLAADSNPRVWKNELFDVLWKIGTPESYDEMIKIIQPLVDEKYIPSMVRLARAYRDGKGVPKDLDKAAEYMRLAAPANSIWKNELFDVLWKIGTPESYGEMVKVAEEAVSTGDKGAVGRLGRAYRDGKGVPKDLDKAAEYMRLAADSNPRVWKNELFDVLWKIGTPESYGEMIKIIQPLVDERYIPSMVRLARAYRDGKGVHEDVEYAKQLMDYVVKEDTRYMDEYNKIVN